MTMLGTIAFKNQDAHVYDFKIYAMDAEMKPGHGGVYVITSRYDAEHHHHGHKILHIGESDDLSTVIESHPDKAMFEAENANSFCVHATQDAAARKRIVEELTARYIK